MLATALYVLLALAPHTAQSQGNQSHPFWGSQESVTPPRHNTSGGMTLEALHGLPMTRPTWPPPQPQVWVYQPYVVVYPANSTGLGGYLPPGVGRSYRPWGLWWGW
jgi:hypothetical protein